MRDLLTRGLSRIYRLGVSFLHKIAFGGKSDHKVGTERIGTCLSVKAKLQLVPCRWMMDLRSL